MITIAGDFYKITNTKPELLWKISIKEKQEFENLHSFLWLTKLDRKNNKTITKNIISSWIENFFNYDPYAWKMEITAKRIIAWCSNTDITLENSQIEFQKSFGLLILHLSNFLKFLFDLNLYFDETNFSYLYKFELSFCN